MKSLLKISVSKNNHVWGVNSGDYIYRRTGNRWQQVSGRLKVVSVGLSGVWGVNSNDDIFYRTATYGDPDSQGTGVSGHRSSSPNKGIYLEISTFQTKVVHFNLEIMET